MEPRAPMLAVRAGVQKSMLIGEHMAVRAFERGYAGKAQFDLLMKMANLLLLAGSSEEKRSYAVKYVEEVVFPVLRSVKERYEKTGKMGASGPELIVMREMIDWNWQFWSRQPIELYHAAYGELSAFYAEVEERRSRDDGGQREVG